MDKVCQQINEINTLRVCKFMKRNSLFTLYLVTSGPSENDLPLEKSIVLIRGMNEPFQSFNFCRVPSYNPPNILHRLPLHEVSFQGQNVYIDLWLLLTKCLHYFAAK